jgi:hypothetical protein
LLFNGKSLSANGANLHGRAKNANAVGQFRHTAPVKSSHWGENAETIVIPAQAGIQNMNFAGLAAGKNDCSESISASSGWAQGGFAKTMPDFAQTDRAPRWPDINDSRRGPSA